MTRKELLESAMQSYLEDDIGKEVKKMWQL
jgi:hypothetical protein